MTLYGTQATNALATLTRKGAAVTFTQNVPGTYDAATDAYTSPSTVTVVGRAVRTDGDARRYQALNLIQSTAPRLLFGSTTTGSLPELGASVVWGGVTYTVRDIDPIEPDGTAIVSYIIIA